jgi:hypothetical protein
MTAGNASTGPGIGPDQLMQLGKEQTDAMLRLQKEVLDTYQEASQAWAARVKTEVDPHLAAYANGGRGHPASGRRQPESDGGRDGLARPRSIG